MQNGSKRKDSREPGPTETTSKLPWSHRVSPESVQGTVTRISSFLSAQQRGSLPLRLVSLTQLWAAQHHTPDASAAALQGMDARGFQSSPGKLVIRCTELIPYANQIPPLSHKMSPVSSTHRGGLTFLTLILCYR